VQGALPKVQVGGDVRYRLASAHAESRAWGVEEIAGVDVLPVAGLACDAASVEAEAESVEVARRRLSRAWVAWYRKVGERGREEAGRPSARCAWMREQEVGVSASGRPIASGGAGHKLATGRLPPLPLEGQSGPRTRLGAHGDP
jgi:hypothetical protein